MLFIYKIKWFFHCLFKFHRQMTVTTQNDKFVGCYECGIVNDKKGNTYVVKRSEK